MAEHTRRDEDQIPEFEGDTDRDIAHDESEKDAGTGTRPDHSEREWGGDQDIDTAGQVPGEMATDVDDAAGF